MLAKALPRSLEESAPRPLFFKATHLLALVAGLACSPAAFSQNEPIPGKWQRQVWGGIDGMNVSDLTDSPRFYQSPDATTLSDSSYSSLGDNYGARTRGYGMKVMALDAQSGSFYCEMFSGVSSPRTADETAQ